MLNRGSYLLGNKEATWLAANTGWLLSVVLQAYNVTGAAACHA